MTNLRWCCARLIDVGIGWKSGYGLAILFEHIGITADFTERNGRQKDGASDHDECLQRVWRRKEGKEGRKAGRKAGRKEGRKI